MIGRGTLALAAAAACGVQVGAAMVATRSVAADVGPFTLAFFRYAIAVACLLPVLVARPVPRIAGRDLAAVVGLGLVQFGLLIALLNVGLRHVTAARASLVFSTFPMLTMLVAAALGRERLAGAAAAGIGITMVGVGAAVGEGGDAPDAPGGWLGIAFVLAAALCGAVCAVLYRPLLQRHSTLAVGALAMGGSVAGLAPFAVAELSAAGLPALGRTGWSAVVFIGLSSGVGYTLWLWALTYASPTRVTMFQALAPVTAALGGAALLGEALTPGAVGGTVAVAAGLWVGLRPAARPER